ncbi:MAG TPA: phosphoribosylformylglycinamidine synthase I [Candidatus Dormibacteraeota bacterium]|nr:phosphoribosylformylglycinamidine synthase I [Candidatus Dormibacteraeota bacterium]
MSRVAVIQYPGSNCDLDALEVVQKVENVNADLVWHKDLKNDYDAYVLPGGFSYGDYLRAGAIAAASPSLKIVREAAEQGKPVLGICNGFQILVEARLLPGAVLRNSGLRFVCTWTRLRVETTRTPFTRLAQKGQALRVPIAHNEGRYYLDEKEIHELERKEQVVLRYVDEKNHPSKSANPNGSVDNIAGICNEKGNVMGLMPHPERASLSILSPDGQTYGKIIFDSMINSLNGERAN